MANTLYLNEIILLFNIKIDTMVAVMKMVKRMLLGLMLLMISGCWSVGSKDMQGIFSGDFMIGSKVCDVQIEVDPLQEPEIVIVDSNCLKVAKKHMAVGDFNVDKDSLDFTLVKERNPIPFHFQFKDGKYVGRVNYLDQTYNLVLEKE